MKSRSKGGKEKGGGSLPFLFVPVLALQDNLSNELEATIERCKTGFDPNNPDQDRDQKKLQK